MRRLLKGILLLALISGLATTTALAWIVYSNGMANVSLTVRRAEASWELTEIEIGEVNSGAAFTARSSTTLTIANAETLYVSFAAYTTTEEELEALESLSVAIGEDTNDDGEIDVMWGTIGIDPEPIVWPAPFPLSEGDYNVVVVVEGIAGYPDTETPIDFVIEGTCETLPVPIP